MNSNSTRMPSPGFAPIDLGPHGIGAMHLLIARAAGMIGRKLTESLVKFGRLGERAVDALTLIDAV